MWNIKLESEIMIEMVSEWETFLLSKDIYRQLYISDKTIPQADRRVRISAGRVLISVYLLESLKDQNSQSYIEEFIQMKNRWLANWKKKVSEELAVRIRQWNQFVIDLDKDINFSQPQMKNQLQIRLMLEFLLDELEENAEKTEFMHLITTLDRKFKYITDENDFIWDNELIDIFPKSRFWFLYRSFDQKR